MEPNGSCVSLRYFRCQKSIVVVVSNLSVMSVQVNSRILFFSPIGKDLLSLLSSYILIQDEANFAAVRRRVLDEDKDVVVYPLSSAEDVAQLVTGCQVQRAQEISKSL